jgi:phosphoribosylformylglycinamidine synthase
MGFAGHVGITVNLDQLCFDPLAAISMGIELRPEAWGPVARRLLSVLSENWEPQVRWSIIPKY